MGARAFFALLGFVAVLGRCTGAESFIWTKNPIDYESDEKHLINHVLSTHNNVHLITQCAFHCLSDDRCKSFNYFERSKQCQVNDVDAVDDPDSLVFNIDAQYVLRDTFQMDESTVGLCAKNPCAHEGHCLDVVTSEGVTKFLCVCKDPWTGLNCTVQGTSLDWSQWSDWDTCSVTCGQGWQRRYRQCVDMETKQEHTAFECLGADVDIKACQLENCPYWSEWSDWTACSTASTCGRGFKSRRRQCMNNGLPGVDRLCKGISNETSPCETPGCMQPLRLVGGATYGEGVVEVYNDITNSWGRVCADAWNIDDANVVCKQLGFSGASQASGASVSGVSSAKKFLTKLGCTGTESSVQSCDHGGWAASVQCGSQDSTVQCIVDGGWNNWSDWGVCSVTCADGQQKRTRTCDYPPALRGGQACTGASEQLKECVLDPCPVDGEWRAWSDWTQCTDECGGGKRTRDRECNLPLHGGSTCTGPTSQEEDCNVQPCPVDCIWKIWSQWEACSVSCEDGTQKRTRTKNVEAQFGGQDCTGLAEESQSCNPGPCPVDGSWAQWAVWAECTVPCGGGTRTRERVCNLGSNGGSDCPGDALQEEACNIHECPVDGVWGEWSDWIECSVSCDDGTQTRSRSCIGPQHGGAECVGDTSQEQACNLRACAEDGHFEEWSEWSTCSTTCGDGSQTRTRECVGVLKKKKVPTATLR